MMEHEDGRKCRMQKWGGQWESPAWIKDKANELPMVVAI